MPEPGSRTIQAARRRSSSRSCLLLGEGVALGAEHHQLVVAPARHLELGVRELAFDQAHVDLEILDSARDFRGVRDVQRDARAGCSRMKRAISGTAR